MNKPLITIKRSTYNKIKSVLEWAFIVLMFLAMWANVFVEMLKMYKA